MLLYIIDAYNVTHRISELRYSDNIPRLFIQYIRRNKLLGSANNKAVLVFDGYTQAPFVDGNITVKFSCNREADDVIRDMMADLKNKSMTVVVTDDRAIRDFVSAQGVKIIRTYDFLKVKKNKKNEITESRSISPEDKKSITEALMRFWDKE